MNKAIGIHVFGRGFGESIVVQCPNGNVGLIDYFSPKLSAADSAARREANPVLRFLSDELKAEKLAFVGFTHPHADHGRGLSQVFDEYNNRIGQIWMFHGFQAVYVERMLLAMRKSTRRVPIEKLLGDAPGTFCYELAKVRDQVLTRIHSKDPLRPKFRSFQGYHEFTIPGEPVHCSFLGPSDGRAAGYERQLTDNLVSAFDASGTEVVPEWSPDDVNHNMISAALLLRYGKTRILLGGDMEIDAWNDVLDEQSEKPVDLTCQLIKIAHHGSTTGFNEAVGLRLSAQGRMPIAVLTPFNRHSRPLPTADGIAQILKHVSELVMTNLQEARNAAGRGETALEADRTTIPEKPAAGVPDSWLADIRIRPELGRALNPDLIQHKSAVVEAPPDVRAIPLNWCADLARKPQLIKVLHPQYQAHLFDRLPTIETDCRVSFFFNDEQTELREQRYVGSAAGTWT